MPIPSAKPGATFPSAFDKWQPRPFTSPFATAAQKPAPVGPAMSEDSKAAQVELAKPASGARSAFGQHAAAAPGLTTLRPSVMPNGTPGAGVSMPAPAPVPVPVAAPVAATGVSAPGIQMDGQTPQAFPRPAIAPGLQPPAPVSTKSFWDDLYAKHPGAGAQPTKPTKSKGRPRL